MAPGHSARLPPRNLRGFFSENPPEAPAHPAACRVRRAMRDVQRAMRKAQRAPCNVQGAVCDVYRRRAACNVQHPKHNVRRAVCNAQRAPCTATPTRREPLFRGLKRPETPDQRNAQHSAQSECKRSGPQGPKTHGPAAARKTAGSRNWPGRPFDGPGGPAEVGQEMQGLRRPETSKRRKCPALRPERERAKRGTGP